MPLSVPPRAQSPRPPQPSAALRKAEAERADYLKGREGLERRSVFRGLILLALLVLAFSLVRAGAGRAFFSGWWRQW